MKASHLFFSALILFAGPVTYAADFPSELSKEARITAKDAGWANVNNIHFTDEFDLFNSGVAQLQVGKTVEVDALIAFSGDWSAIEQAQVLFENVGSGIRIDYDQTIHFDPSQKQARFRFFITLTEPIPNGATRMFTVKVSDKSLGDNQHLTPYSQTQTVIQGDTDSTTDSSINPGSDSSIEPSTDSSTEPSTDSSTEPSTDSSTEPSTDSSTEPSTESSTGESTDPSSSTETESSERPGSKTSTDSSTKPSGEIDSSPKAKSSKTKESTSGVTISAQNSSSAKLSKKSAAAYKYFPKTGENEHNYLMIMGGIVSALGAFLLLKRRK